MKKSILFLGAMMISLAFASCNTDTTVNQSNNETPTARQDQQQTSTPTQPEVDLTSAVEFADPNFEQAVRSAFELDGVITSADLADIKYINSGFYFGGIIGTGIGAVNSGTFMTFGTGKFNYSAYMLMGAGYLAQTDGNTFYSVDFAESDEFPGSLEDLRHFPNLEFLSIDGMVVTDLEFVRDLPNLRHLSVTYLNLPNLEPLRDRSDIESLRLGRYSSPLTSTEDFSGFAGLNGLRDLSLNGFNISDISFITELNDLSNLTLLDLSGNNIQDISPLMSIKSLEILELRENNIKDLNAVIDMPNLKTLNWDLTPGSNSNQNRVPVLGTFEGCPNLVIPLNYESVAAGSAKIGAQGIDTGLLNMLVNERKLNEQVFNAVKANTRSWEGLTWTGKESWQGGAIE